MILKIVAIRTSETRGLDGPAAAFWAETIRGRGS